MGEFAILTNRKRAVIALAHSIVFFLIALRAIATAAAVRPIWLAGPALAPSVVMLSIYFVVSSVLIQLVRISRCTRERLYFGFCASSAALGLLRAVFGDANLPAVLYLRVVMLLLAVGTGTMILRGHSRMAVLAENEL